MKCFLCIKLQLHLEPEMVENPRDGVRIMQQQNKVKHWIFSNSNNEIVFVHFDIWSTAGNIWILERITDLNCFKLGRNLVGKRIQLISDIGMCSTHFAANLRNILWGSYKFLTCLNYKCHLVSHALRVKDITHLKRIMHWSKSLSKPFPWTGFVQHVWMR